MNFNKNKHKLMKYNTYVYVDTTKYTFERGA